MQIRQILVLNSHPDPPPFPLSSIRLYGINRTHNKLNSTNVILEKNHPSIIITPCLNITLKKDVRIEKDGLQQIHENSNISGTKRLFMKSDISYERDYDISFLSVNTSVIPSHTSLKSEQLVDNIWKEQYLRSLF